MTARKSTRALAALFVASGAAHLARPAMYEPIMPTWVPRHRDVVVGSGLAELALAAGLLAPATRRASGWASVGLLLAVYTANLKQAKDALRGDNTAYQAAVLARLPMQWPMIRAALAAGRGDG